MCYKWMPMWSDYCKYRKCDYWCRKLGYICLDVATTTSAIVTNIAQLESRNEYNVVVKNTIPIMVTSILIKQVKRNIFLFHHVKLCYECLAFFWYWSQIYLSWTLMMLVCIVVVMDVVDQLLCFLCMK